MVCLEKTGQSGDGGDLTWNDPDARTGADTGTSGTALQKIGSTASPLAMIYVGGIFAGISFRRYIREISLYGIVLVKMIVAPILLFLILGIFPVGEEIRMAMALIVGMPTMTAVVMMTNASGLDGDYALGGVFVTTVCGIMTLPMVCWILQNIR